MVKIAMPGMAIGETDSAVQVCPACARAQARSNTYCYHCDSSLSQRPNAPYRSKVPYSALGLHPADYHVLNPVADVEQPLISVVLPTFNRTAYLRESLASILHALPANAQVLVMDNHSEQSDPAAVVTGFRDSRIEYHRQDRNIGILNWIDGLRRTRGRYVHLMHDDDRVLPGFYDQALAVLEQHTHVGMVCCRAVEIDEHGRQKALMHEPRGMSRSGIIPDAQLQLACGNFVMGPSVVVHRSVYEQIGSYHLRMSYVNDWELWIRIANAYGIGYVSTPLLEYRIHTDAGGLKELLDDMAPADWMEEVIGLSLRALPVRERHAVEKQAWNILLGQVAAGFNAARTAGNKRLARRYARRMFKLRPSPRSALRLVGTFL